MRLISYNIYNGGEGRADPIAEVIEAQHADVVALVEANVPEVTQRIARRLKMDFVVGEGDGHHVALLSRWPIVESVNHALVSGIKRSCLEATVRDAAGVEWTFGVVHLPAGAKNEDEQTRLPEIEKILKVFAPHRLAGRGHVLCGDFNSNSPQQLIDPSRCREKTRAAWKDNGGVLPREVVGRILGEGYVDAHVAVNGQENPLVGSFDTQFPGQRVDYCFTFGIAPKYIERAWVEQDRLAKFASDHFPIGVEIRV